MQVKRNIKKSAGKKRKRKAKQKGYTPKKALVKKARKSKVKVAVNKIKTIKLRKYYFILNFKRYISLISKL